MGQPQIMAITGEQGGAATAQMIAHAVQSAIHAATTSIGAGSPATAAAAAAAGNVPPMVSQLLQGIMGSLGGGSGSANSTTPTANTGNTAVNNTTGGNSATATTT